MTVLRSRSTSFETRLWRGPKVSIARMRGSLSKEVRHVVCFVCFGLFHRLVLAFQDYANIHHTCKLCTSTTKSEGSIFRSYCLNYHKTWRVSNQDPSPPPPPIPPPFQLMGYKVDLHWFFCMPGYKKHYERHSSLADEHSWLCVILNWFCSSVSIAPDRPRDLGQKKLILSSMLVSLRPLPRVVSWSCLSTPVPCWTNSSVVALASLLIRGCLAEHLMLIQAVVPLCVFESLQRSEERFPMTLRATPVRAFRNW